jgi:hypothetical protein
MSRAARDNRKMPNTQPKKELIFTDDVPTIGTQVITGCWKTEPPPPGYTRKTFFFNRKQQIPMENHCATPVIRQ